MKLRKMIITALASAMLFSLAACGDASNTDDSTETVTTTEATEESTDETTENNNETTGDDTDGAAGENADEAAEEKSEDDEVEDFEFEMPNGTTEKWGIYEEVFVPEGMKLTTGSTIDPDDENSVWVSKTDNALNYFYFVLSTEEQSEKDVAATLETNDKYDPEEVTLKVGGVVWKGVGYNYLGSDVAQMYATIGDTVINVRMAGFAYNSDYTAAVLSSIKVKEGAASTASTETGDSKDSADSKDSTDSKDATDSADSKNTTDSTDSKKTTDLDPTYGKSNADATGYTTLDALRETHEWMKTAGLGITYEDIKERTGCDGAIWEEIWKDDKHGYKWRTEDGDFLHVSFKVDEDGSEVYSSCSYSDGVK